VAFFANIAYVLKRYFYYFYWTYSGRVLYFILTNIFAINLDIRKQENIKTWKDSTHY